MIKDSTLATIEKNHGKGSMYQMGDGPIEDIDVIPTGNIKLDLALGVGGYARGRIVEIYGPESSGKTTLTLHAVAEAQKLGLECVFIDAEHALDPRYAEAIGVNLQNLYISQPDSGEQALGIALDCAKSNEVGLVVIDSVAALVPRAELAGDIGDSHVGLQARLMSQSMRLMAGAAEKSGTTLFFINQLREKIGVMFGSPETTPGGRALKFYASQRLDIRRKDQIKDGVEIIGNKTKIKVVKNKVAPPFAEAEIEIYYGEGISTENSLLELGDDYGILEKKGSWWYMDGESLGNSKGAARLTLKENPDMVDDLYNRITEAINGDEDEDANE